MGGAATSPASLLSYFGPSGIPLVASVVGVALSAAVVGHCGGVDAKGPGEAPSPRLQDPAAVQFIAFGDAGKGNRGQRDVAAAMLDVCRARGCDFALMLGDNLYQRGFEEPRDPRMKERFDEVYLPLDIPVYGVLGNHDYATGRDTLRAQWQVDWAADHNQLEMPAHFYRFEAGPATFFALDTNRVFQWGEAEQSAWLAQALPESTAQWTVVFGHHPYRSNGRHGNAGRYEGWKLPLVGGSALKTLCDTRLCGQADLYLAGHDHTLQSLQWCGMELVVSGAGATRTPLVDRGNETRFEASQLGFAWIRLDRNMTLAFHADEGKLLFERVLTRSEGVR